MIKGTLKEDKLMIKNDEDDLYSLWNGGKHESNREIIWVKLKWVIVKWLKIDLISDSLIGLQLCYGFLQKLDSVSYIVELQFAYRILRVFLSILHCFIVVGVLPHSSWPRLRRLAACHAVMRRFRLLSLWHLRWHRVVLRLTVWYLRLDGIVMSKARVAIGKVVLLFFLLRMICLYLALVLFSVLFFVRRKRVPPRRLFPFL